MWNSRINYLICLCMFWEVLPIHAQDGQEINKLEKFYHDKCLKNTGSPAVFDKLRADTYEMYKYLQYAIQFLPAQKEIFCKNERDSLLLRMKEISNDLKPCLMPEEKYLAGFIKESFSEFLHFLCHNDGEYTKRFFNSEGSECRKKVEGSKTTDLENCMNRIFPATKDYITKKEMCDDVTVARKCFNQLLEVYCPDSYNTKRLNDIFFDYISKPCSSCIHSISLVLLFGSLLIQYLLQKI